MTQPTIRRPPPTPPASGRSCTHLPTQRYNPNYPSMFACLRTRSPGKSHTDQPGGTAAGKVAAANANPTEINTAANGQHGHGQHGTPASCGPKTIASTVPST